MSSPKIPRTCEICKTIFMVHPHTLLEPKNGRFCSKPCKGIWMRGKPPGNARHFMTSTPTWKSWDGMKQRCLNPKCKDYPRWGGRGITIDPAWIIFDAFYADMGVKPEGTSLGRIDNDGPYSKANCRWETIFQQANNRRSTRTITANGETLTIAQWAQRIGASRQMVRYRIEAGWTPEDAVTIPPDHSNRRPYNA